MSERKIYQSTKQGGVQLGASPERWHLESDHIDLSPHHRPIRNLLWVDTDEIPVVEDTRRMALIVVDMQNDFCTKGGWADQAGFKTERTHSAIPGIKRVLKWAREQKMWVIWIGWANRTDLRNLGPSTLYQYKKNTEMKGIGENLGDYRALIEDTWGTELVEELAALQEPDDVIVDKVRTSGFYETHLDQILKNQGLKTLLFAGINTDQCVTATLEDACFRDYNVILVEDATATSSPDFCKDAVIHNTRLCWGFVTDSHRLTAAKKWDRKVEDQLEGAKSKD